jgi:hypothetical protein
VLAHVGVEQHQRPILSELARVANQFIVYTPYRYFPVEMHTFFPFLHWLPSGIYRAAWRKAGLAFWADERNLNLLSVGAGKTVVTFGGISQCSAFDDLRLATNIEIHWRHRMRDHNKL